MTCSVVPYQERDEVCLDESALARALGVAQTGGKKEGAASADKDPQGQHSETYNFPKNGFECPYCCSFVAKECCVRDLKDNKHAHDGTDYCPHPTSRLDSPDLSREVIDDATQDQHIVDDGQRDERMKYNADAQ